MLNAASHLLIFLETGVFFAYAGLAFPALRSPAKTCALAVGLAAGLTLCPGIAELLALGLLGRPVAFSSLWMLCLCAVCARLLFRCPWGGALACGALYYTALFALEHLARCGLLLAGRGGLLEDWGWPYLFIRLAATCVLAAVRLLLRGKKAPSGAFFTGHRLFLLLCGLALADACLLSAVRAPAAGALQTALLTLLFALFFRYERMRGAEARAREAQLRGLLLERQIQDLEEARNREARQRHDLKNHLTALRDAAARRDWQAVGDYLDAMEPPAAPAIVRTGNSAADAMINSKYALARMEGIAFTADADDLAGLSIRSADMCAVLGNLLDNALEASRKAPPERRQIFLRIRRRSGIVAILTANGVRENPLDADPALRSQKGPGHGLGLACIRAAAAPYQGGIEHFYRDGLFHTVVTLSVPTDIS